MLFLDGVYIGGSKGLPVRFRRVNAPTRDKLAQLTHNIAHRVGRYLERQCLLERDAGNSYLTAQAVDTQDDNFAYCACKAGIIAMTKSLAADGGPLGIRVNCVCPGFVHTPIMDKAHSKKNQTKISAQLPARRMATTREVADAFVYLASDEASYTNGSVLFLDGAATVGFAGCYVEFD